MAKFIGADSLAFISIEGLYRALGEPKREIGAPKFCDACFTGDYPIPPSDFSQGNLAASLSQMAEFSGA
jgi:amidophosphoribosyltransferase